MTNTIQLFGLEVLTAVILKRMLFWVVTPCSSERTLRARRTHPLYLQGRRVSQEMNPQKQTENSYFYSVCVCVVSAVLIYIVTR
jgi:hypothetical protein